MISIAAMAVSMILMYLGINAGIIVFFAACPMLLFGLFTAHSAKERILYAIETDTQPIPMFWHIRYAILATGEFISRRGLWRFIFTVLTALSLTITIVLAGFCGHYYLERDDILRNVDYMKNDAVYNEKYEIWRQYKADGNNEAAHSIYIEMQPYKDANAESDMQITVFTEKLNTFKIHTVVSGVISAFFAAVLTVYIIKVRFSKKKTRNLNS